MTKDEMLKVENNYTVYMHKNKINGKVYIGITYQNVKYRWRKNGDISRVCKGKSKTCGGYHWKYYEE